MIKRRYINLDIAKAISFILLIALHLFLNTQFYQTAIASRSMYLAVFIRTICMPSIPVLLIFLEYLKYKRKYNKNTDAFIKGVITLFIIVPMIGLMGYNSTKAIKELSVKKEKKIIYKWKKYQDNQILGNNDTMSLFDPSVLIDPNSDKKFKLYVSKRDEGSIVLYTSNDGINFDEDYTTIIKSNDIVNYEYNRPSILLKDGIYYLYYTKQWDKTYSEIYVATSTDGINFEFNRTPVLNATLDFEENSVMNPNVIYDEENNEFKMYYAAGEIYEPDYIGLATSKDGIHFTKEKKPVLEKNTNTDSYDYYKVGATDVHIINGIYYMFYIGYTDINTARILLTTSKDGIHFDRENIKLIVAPSENGFDKDACYKPSAVYDKEDDKWYLYYNGRTIGDEFIGLYTKKGYELN